MNEKDDEQGTLRRIPSFQEESAMMMGVSEEEETEGQLAFCMAPGGVLVPHCYDANMTTSLTNNNLYLVLSPVYLQQDATYRMKHEPKNRGFPL